MTNPIDDLGDHLKSFEALSTQRRAIKGQPIVVRLDGKAFHTFTRGLDKPFDLGLTQLMQETTKHLIQKYHANIGYTQSDEITLAFYVSRESKSEYIFDGRFQKLESLLAASASVEFNKLIPRYVPSKINASAVFDARAFAVASLEDVYDAFMWRQQDAKKNSVSMAAHAHFSHKSLQGLHSKQMIEKLYSEKGIVFGEYHDQFRAGSFIVNRSREMPISEEILAKIPVDKRPQEGQLFKRTIVEVDHFDLPSRPVKEDFEKFFEIARFEKKS